MNTIQKLIAEKQGIPESTAWYLNDLAEAKGRQQMYMLQSPQRLKALREHALIDSAVSSNRIEGVQVDPKRVNAVILGRALLTCTIHKCCRVLACSFARNKSLLRRP